MNSKHLKSEDFSDGTVNKAWIDEALQSLSLEQRRIIELRIIKGHSVEETAREMNKKEGTIRVIQFRALKILADFLNNI